MACNPAGVWESAVLRAYHAHGCIPLAHRLPLARVRWCRMFPTNLVFVAANPKSHRKARLEAFARHLGDLLGRSNASQMRHRGFPRGVTNTYRAGGADGLGPAWPGPAHHSVMVVGLWGLAADILLVEGKLDRLGKRQA